MSNIFHFHDMSDDEKQILGSMLPSPVFYQYLGRVKYELTQQLLTIGHFSDPAAFQTEYRLRQDRIAMVEDLENWLTELSNQSKER